VTTTAEDPFHLERFVEAQSGIYSAAMSELRSGKKYHHWMWFIFPQIAGLGFSSMTSFYAVKSLDEAKAYLSHPLLGYRLEECTDALLALDGFSASEIFGYPDDLKFCSSMTLFDVVATDDSMLKDTLTLNNTQVFKDALTKYCGGRRDEKTLALIQGNSSS